MGDHLLYRLKEKKRMNGIYSFIKKMVVSHEPGAVNEYTAIDAIWGFFFK